MEDRNVGNFSLLWDKLNEIASSAWADQLFISRIEAAAQQQFVEVYIEYYTFWLTDLCRD